MVAGHRSTQEGWQETSAQVAGRRWAEHILPGKPLEGPWASRMQLTGVRDPAKAALHFFAETDR